MLDWLPVFKDKLLDQELKKSGIVKFDLSNAAMASNVEKKLAELVPNYDTNIGEHFYGSVSLQEKRLKEKVHQELSQLLSPFLESILSHHKLLIYFYLVKVVGEKSVLNLHQDWSIIDERKFRAYNVWIPLVDSTIENGTLHALKGSQNFPLNIRGANISPKYFEHFDVAKQYMQPIDVKLGEALLFDSRLLHFSPPNRSNKARTAVVNNIIPTETETLSFHGNESEGKLSVNQYKVPEDLFIHYNDFVNQKDDPNPKGELIGEIDHGNIGAVSNEEFQQLLKEFVIKKKWYHVFK